MATGLQARPACSANVQSVQEFHATLAICMRRSAPLSSLRAARPKGETRDANAEEATGEKQLLRLERPFQTAVATYNVIQNARGFLTKQVMRCRARLTAPLGRAQPPLSTTPYQDMTYSGGHPREALGPRAALGADANPQTPQWARHSGTPGTHSTLASGSHHSAHIRRTSPMTAACSASLNHSRMSSSRTAG